MFGIVRPCRHRLRGPLFGEWMAHLCGLCLTLRDLHGQSARLVTNYDGLMVSVLTEAQNPAVAPHRTAGPCALRGFRRADVLGASAPGARLAASVSLVLAAGKIRDHIADRDGAYARRLVASGAGLAAGHWQSAGERAGASIGFDTSVLTDAIARQAMVERSGVLTLPEVTEPTETAVSAAFAHTAELAGQPRNAGALAAAGRSFGRIAHLIDAVEDLPADREADAYNPLLATGTSPAQAGERCADALGDLKLAVASLELERAPLAESLLVGEVNAAVDRAFRQIVRGTGLAGGSHACGTGGPGGVLGGAVSWPGSVISSVGPCRRGYGPGRRREGCCDCCCDCGDCDCGDCDCGDCDCGDCDCGGCDCC